MVPNVIKDLGPDIVIGPGGGVHAHQQGPVARAKAIRQAIQATLQGRPLEETAKECPELKMALETWVDAFKGMGM